MHCSPEWNDLVQSSSGDVRRLASVWRFSSIPIAVDENTAEHSYWVALYAAMIHRTAAPDGLFQGILGPILLKALVHDLAECVTGDVVRVFKYSTPELKQEVDRAENILMKKLPNLVQDLVGEAEQPQGNDKAYISAVVKCADFLSLFQFMRREAMRGNSEIAPFYGRMITDLETMASDERELVVGKDLKFRPSELYTAMFTEARAIYRFKWNIGSNNG